ncbi:MAG: hypothetical protein HYX96_09460 [Chloroflexi bacterium]|nr:hypothetical protein [Chloroflexota bacterium]
MELMARGLPAVVVLGEDFIRQSQLIAGSRGFRLKYVIIPRTINAMKPPEIEKEADRVAGEAAARLLAREAA